MARDVSASRHGLLLLLLAGSCALPALEKVGDFDSSAGASAGADGSSGSPSRGGESNGGSSAGASEGGSSGTESSPSGAGGTGPVVPVGGSAASGSAGMAGDGGTNAAGAGGGEQCPEESQSLMLSDLEDSTRNINPPRLGHWFGTPDNGATDVLPSGAFVPSPGGANGTSYAAILSGKGGDLATLGIQFDCCPGASLCSYDASAHRGVTFWYKSPRSMRVSFGTLPTTHVNDGGTCTDAEGGLCWDRHQTVLAASAEWKQRTISFGDLEQSFNDTPFESAKLTAIFFEITGTYNPDTQSVEPLGTWSIAIDELELAN